MIQAREQLLHFVFHDLTFLYLTSSDDRFAELFFEDLDGAHRILDELIVSHVQRWPSEVRQQLGLALGASLVFRRAQLIGSVTPSSWNEFSDPADVLYGYVFWKLFPRRDLSEFVLQEVNWDSSPLDDLVEAHGPLPSHDWSKY